MNTPRLGDVKTGLVIIIRKIMLRSKQNSMTENTKEPAQGDAMDPSDFTNWSKGGSSNLNQQSGGGSSEKSAEKNGKGELPPDSGGVNQ